MSILTISSTVLNDNYFSSLASCWNFIKGKGLQLCVCMCVHVCVRLYVCVCLYVCVYLYMCECVCVWVCVCVCVCVCACACVCVCVSIGYKCIWKIGKYVLYLFRHAPEYCIVVQMSLSSALTGSYHMWKKFEIDVLISKNQGLPCIIIIHCVLW